MDGASLAVIYQKVRRNNSCIFENMGPVGDETFIAFTNTLSMLVHFVHATERIQRRRKKNPQNATFKDWSTFFFHWEKYATGTAFVKESRVTRCIFIALHEIYTWPIFLQNTKKYSFIMSMLGDKTSSLLRVYIIIIC